MKLDDLRCFMNIARTGNFARGAALSHITPPAASKAVRRLEEALDVSLFTRTTRHVSLTAAGDALLGTCHNVFGELERLQDVLDESASRIRGPLHIAAMEVFSHQLLPAALSLLAAEFPEVVPRTYEMIPQKIEALIDEGRIDVGFTIGGRNRPTLHYETIGSSRGLVVCGKGHPLYTRGRVAATALKEYPFVVPEFLGMEHLPVLDQFPDDHYRRTVGATIELMHMGIQLAVSGTYLGYFPEVSVRDELKDGRLREVRGLRHHATFDLCAIRPKRQRNRAVDLLIERTKSTLG